MISPSGKIGVVTGLRNYSTDGLILNVDFSNDYGFAGNTANDLRTDIEYSTPGGYVAVISGSTAAPGYIDLDGITDYLPGTTGTSDFLNLQSFTIDAWIRPSTTSGIRTIISNNTNVASTANRGFSVILANNTLDPRLGSTATSLLYSQLVTGVTCAANQWNNLFIRYSVTGATGTYTAKVFKEGGLSASDYTGSQSSGLPLGLTSSNAIALGRRAMSAIQYFQGRIGTIRMYNKALTTDEIEFNYARNRTRYGHT
jgi:hypothetical protein